MDSIEVILTDLSEESGKRLAQKKPKGLEENKKIARQGGKIAKITRDNLEEALGESVITKSYKIISILMIIRK